MEYREHHHLFSPGFFGWRLAARNPRAQRKLQQLLTLSHEQRVEGLYVAGNQEVGLSRPEDFSTIAPELVREILETGIEDLGDYSLWALINESRFPLVLGEADRLWRSPEEIEDLEQWSLRFLLEDARDRLEEALLLTWCERQKAEQLQAQLGDADERLEELQADNARQSSLLDNRYGLICELRRGREAMEKELTTANCIVRERDQELEEAKRESKKRARRNSWFERQLTESQGENAELKAENESLKLLVLRQIRFNTLDELKSALREHCLNVVVPNNSFPLRHPSAEHLGWVFERALFLNDYVEQGAPVGMIEFVNRSAFDGSGYAAKESETVVKWNHNQDPGRKKSRWFPVDPRIDPSGWSLRQGKVRMFSHFKRGSNGESLRMHIFDDANGHTGRVHIGYVGSHLDTKKTR